MPARAVETICLYLIDRYFLGGRNPSELRYVMDRAALESAVAAPRQTFGGKDLFDTIEGKAACLFRSLVKNHAFIEGNKRTAVVATYAFIGMNGYEVLAGPGEFYDLAIEVAESRDNDAILRHLEQWFSQKIRRTRQRRRT